MRKKGWIIAGVLSVIVCIIGCLVNWTITTGFLLGAVVSIFMYWRNVQFVDFVMATAVSSKGQVFMRSMLSIVLMFVSMALAAKYPQYLNVFAVAGGLLLIKVSIIAQEIGKERDK